MTSASRSMGWSVLPRRSSDCRPRSGVVPSPRCFGRSQAGLRVMRQLAAGLLEFEHHLGPLVGRRVLAAQVPGAAFLAAALAEQREADRIQQAGLAGPGRAADQEQPVRAERCEVDLLPRGIGAEPVHRERQRAHQAVAAWASAIAAVTTACASAGSGAPRMAMWNSPNRSKGFSARAAPPGTTIGPVGRGCSA